MALHTDPPGEQRSWIFWDKGWQQQDVHPDLVPCVLHEWHSTGEVTGQVHLGQAGDLFP